MYNNGENRIGGQLKFQSIYTLEQFVNKRFKKNVYRVLEKLIIMYAYEAWSTQREE